MFQSSFLIFNQIKGHEYYVLLLVDLIRILLAENLPLICDAFSTTANIPKSYENLEITDLYRSSKSNQVYISFSILSENSSSEFLLEPLENFYT